MALCIVISPSAKEATMKIIEIVPLSNGAHRNQNGGATTIPDGWAVIPDTMGTPNFPFGTVTAEEIDGVMAVTGWVAGVIPEPVPEPEPAPTEAEQLRADVDYIAVMTGVTL